MIIDLLQKYYFTSPRDFVVFLGDKRQVDSLATVVYAKNIWIKEPCLIKLGSIFKREYFPSDEKLRLGAYKVFVHDIFGRKQDYGDRILKLMIWHNSQEWIINNLTPLDKNKADGLQTLSVLTRTVFSKKASVYLNLNLAERSPLICSLIFPMVVKIPIISVRNYLDIHSSFAFNSIRHSIHPKAEDLISYLYDILFIQQKIANSLHQYLIQVTHVEDKKNNANLTMAEVTAIMGADLVFTYLKASIEKTVVFIGLIYEIANLEAKKTHKQRLAALISGLPSNVKTLYYFTFIHEFIKSENLEELNNYRSGLLHKKGISDLQPHNYVGKSAETIPLRKIFDILLEQHAKNTAVLIGSLALLTDDLVNRDHDDINFEEFSKVMSMQNEP